MIRSHSLPFSISNRLNTEKACLEMTPVPLPNLRFSIDPVFTSIFWSFRVLTICFTAIIFFCTMSFRTHSTVESVKERSEERRVGKECRYGWWPENEKEERRES